MGFTHLVISLSTAGKNLSQVFGRYASQPYLCTPKRKLGFHIMSQRIRIKLQSYDHNLVDKSAEKIVKTVRSTGAVVTGPIPLPTRRKIFTVLRSPHVNKKSREQFQLATHKRLLDIYTSSSRTVDALSKLDLPSGVEVEIKA
jgi:small subunit ribosomal protein S10